MRYDERHCPHCGHDVLDWYIKCAGCGQVPRYTREGRRIIGRLQFWDAVSSNWIAAAVALAVLMISVISAINILHLQEDVRARRAAEESS